MCNESQRLNELPLRARRGDTHALAELFAHYRERLRRMVEFRMDPRLHQRADPSDILQDAYLDACQRSSNLPEPSEASLFVWFRQLVMQRLIDVHRRHLGAQKRSVKREVSIHHANPCSETSTILALQLVGRLTTPSSLAVQAELLDEVESALQEMDAIDREVLAMRHFEELSNNETAEALGISKAASSNRYVRALTRLRVILSRVPGFFDESEAGPPD
jgi:RNA polymerase sigma-70 factor (ECF subfamily)